MHDGGYTDNFIWRSWKSCTPSDSSSVRQYEAFRDSPLETETIFFLLLIEGSCLSRIILVKNSRSLKARPFRTRSIVLYIRRVPYMARNSHFHKSRAPSRGSPDRIFYHSAISPRTISRAYPRTLNDATMHRSMGIIHRQCFISPATLPSLVMFRHGRALILKSCLAFYSLLETTQSHDCRRVVTSSNMNIRLALETRDVNGRLAVSGTGG